MAGVEGTLLESNGVPVDPPISITGATSLPMGTHVIEWTVSDGVQVTQVVETVSVIPGIQATERFHLNDRSELQGTLFSSGSGNTHLGTDTTADDILSVGPVDVQWRSVVDGDIVSAEGIFVQPDVGVSGAQSPYTAVALPGLPALPPIPVGTDDIYANAEPIALTPGAYRSLTLNSGADVTLGSGTYTFSNGLIVNSATTLTVEPDTRLLIGESFALRSPMVNGAGALQPIFVGYAGANMVVEADFDGRLLAPNAHVQFGVGQTLDFRGSFLGRVLELRPDVTVTCDGGIGDL